jgi:hypothetical protein
MTGSIRNFELEIDAYLHRDIPEQVQLLQRVLATAGLNSLVLHTPVRTGRARGAWITTVNSLSFEAPENLGNAGAVAALAINAGLAAIHGAPPFSSIIIQNNVEYIEELEDGSSTQAPQGMLAVTVAEIERMVA